MTSLSSWTAFPPPASPPAPSSERSPSPSGWPRPASSTPAPAGRPPPPPAPAGSALHHGRRLFERVAVQLDRQRLSAGELQPLHLAVGHLLRPQVPAGEGAPPPQGDVRR